MAQEFALVSAALMGLLVVSVAVGILRLRSWQHYTVKLPRRMATTAADARARRSGGAAGVSIYDPEPNPFALPGESLVERLLHSQVVWYLGFVLVALGFGGAVLLAMTVGPDAASVTILSLFAVILGLWLPLGLYVVFRSRGHASAWAAGETAVVLGALAVVAIVVDLVGVGLG